MFGVFDAVTRETREYVDMSRSPLIVKPSNYQPAMNVVGTSVEVIVSDTATHGHDYTFQSGPEGAGPPPHSHDWDESFFVTKGSVEITCAGRTETCERGTLAFVPGGTIHSFSFGPDGGEMLEIAGPRGAAIQMFTDLSEEIEPEEPDLKRVVEVMRRNGATVHL